MAAKTCITDIIYLKNSPRGTSRARLVPKVSCHSGYTLEHKAQSQQSGKDNWVTGKGGTQSKRKPSLSTAPAFLYSRSHESTMMQHDRLKVFLLKSIIMRGSKFLYSMFLHTGCWLAIPQPFHFPINLPSSHSNPFNASVPTSMFLSSKSVYFC